MSQIAAQRTRQLQRHAKVVYGSGGKIGHKLRLSLQHDGCGLGFVRYLEGKTKGQLMIQWLRAYVYTSIKKFRCEEDDALTTLKALEVFVAEQLRRKVRKTSAEGNQGSSGEEC